MTRLLALAMLGFLTTLGSVAGAQESTLKATDQLTVPQWINPATPGVLKGRVILPSTDGTSVAIPNATVVVTSQDGVTNRTLSDSEGNFELKGVETGVYALSARAPGAFACCAMHVVDGKMDSADKLPQEVEVSAAAIDYTVVKTSIIRYLPPIKKQSPYTIAQADLEGISPQVVGDSLFRVLQADGGLKGRIRLAGANGDQLADAGVMNIFLVRKGEVIDRVLSKRNGTFQFSDLEPGEYAILAIGEAGLGMAGFELVDESLASSITSSSLNNPQSTLVTTYSDPCCCCPTEFSMQIAPLPLAVEAVSEVIVEQPMQGESVAVDENGNPIGGVDQYGNPIAGVDQFGNPIGGVDQFGNPIGGSGFGDPGLGMGGDGGLGSGGGAAGGGGFAGGAGGGFGGGAGGGLGGLGGLASLAGLAGIAASNSNNGSSAPVVVVSPGR